MNKTNDNIEEKKNNSDNIHEKIDDKIENKNDNSNENNIDKEKDLNSDKNALTIDPNINDNKINNINNRLERGINLLIKNKLDIIHSTKKNKNLLINSNWNHSSNFKLNTFNNDYLFYKNKFMKNLPIKDKILKDSKKEKGIILPEIKTPQVKKGNLNINVNNNIFYHFTKIPKESLVNNNINNEQKNELLYDKTNLFRNIKLNRIININNNDTQTTQSATNSTKNQNSSKNNIIPNINEDINKYEMNLISGGSTPNNNIVIPLLTLKHPLNQSNTGEKNGINLKENENIKNEKCENKIDIINMNLSHNSRNKNNKSRELKGKINISMKNKELYNLFSEVQKYVPNFHKIKIEKGIDNNNLLKSYSKKISYDYKSKNNLNFYDNNLNNKSYND